MIEQEPYLSIVIPVYNEEESLQPLSEELEAALQAMQQPYEIIFVDDGSTDDSFAVLQQLQEADPDHVRVVSFRRNFGKTAALSVGFKRARGEVVVTMDADLQDDPQEMPKLLNKLEEGWDLVAAWRERRQDPVSKTLPSRVANAVVARFTGLELHDFNCGFKAYRAQVVRELKLYGDLHRYIPVLASWQGFRVAEVPVLHRPRRFGRSKYGWQRMVRGFFDLMVVLFLTHYLRRPLQLFGIAGAVCLLIGFIVGLYLTYLRFFGPGIGWRPALFFDVMAIVVGVQLISIGLLGEMLRNFSYRSEDEYSIRTEL
jgi:glycosyltransferase involved in cell wall biosynthesis